MEANGVITWDLETFFLYIVFLVVEFELYVNALQFVKKNLGCFR